MQSIHEVLTRRLEKRNRGREVEDWARMGSGRVAVALQSRARAGRLEPVIWSAASKCAEVIDGARARPI
jgi:hypothetical protein